MIYICVGDGVFSYALDTAGESYYHIPTVYYCFVLLTVLLCYFILMQVWSMW